MFDSSGSWKKLTVLKAAGAAAVQDAAEVRGASEIWESRRVRKRCRAALATAVQKVAVVRRARVANGFALGVDGYKLSA